MKKILIIDDDREICLLLRKYLTKKGFETHEALSGKEAEKWLKKQEVDLILCDFKLPDYNGLEMLEKIKIIRPAAKVIIITGYSDVRIAVEALKKGAFEYVTKPLYPDEIMLTIINALETEHKQAAPVPKKPSRPEASKTDFISGKSLSAQKVNKHIELIAPTDMSVIILGETGTGKEYVARAIHQKSARSGAPFIAVDCGALPKDLAGSELFGHVKGAFTGALRDKKGCFELANEGTLFLDEIGNLSYENQIKLLRVLQERKVKPLGGSQERKVDVRIIVATNEDLKTAVRKGEFREDIYHRLNEFKIELSPLRERKEDIEVFALHFLKLANEQLRKNVESIDKRALKILENYTWHGNLRELKNVIKRAVLLCDGPALSKEHLPEEIIFPVEDDQPDFEILIDGEAPPSLKAVTEAAEKTAIINALKRTNNNKSKTAEVLQVDRKTLYNKLKAYNLS
ncbi:sigma-54 dependent transcriptional regulator [Roseivirga sp. UBA1976]|uniref:sigma-54-dependent transcriptional regulator n=1 Tax=Roseivirga sp. UBA1976 TaxID=1947386 RepID=UPI00257C4B52|nr:sigma-54 dependent transcriptional regulator [Roseivirga sp. UBA1976]MEC7754557.1 sigma-54 dependent transcriptional regulator [Bacteroidota bacterium]